MAGRRRKTETQYVMISVVAEKYGIHPQTLRLYEREGLIRPTRSAGNTRLYDEDALRRLEIILTLTRDLGVNLAGVEVILNMKERMDKMQGDMERLLDAVRRLAEERRTAAASNPHALVKVQSGPLTKVNRS
ncbi:MAG TPA: MerR family transcriptional regulator [Thermoanaerobaculia bacterium]|nr:MerR family transcriptional regulator [Thermoanaerobaculia bacterium]